MAPLAFGFDEVFLAAVLRAEALISDHPLAGPAWPDLPEQARIRQVLIPGFPNALAYRIEESDFSSSRSSAFAWSPATGFGGSSRS